MGYYVNCIRTMGSEVLIMIPKSDLEITVEFHEPKESKTNEILGVIKSTRDQKKPPSNTTLMSYQTTVKIWKTSKI